MHALLFASAGDAAIAADSALVNACKLLHSANQGDLARVRQKSGREGPIQLSLTEDDCKEEPSRSLLWVSMQLVSRAVQQNNLIESPGVLFDIIDPLPSGMRFPWGGQGE